MPKRSNYDPHKASVIKRLNQRQAEIVRQFGKDSQSYRDYHNALLVVVGPENINENGNIKRGPSTYSILTEEVMSALLRHQTAGQIKASARREAREESVLSGDHITMEDIISVRDKMDKIIRDEPKEVFYEVVKFYWESVGGEGHTRPSYTQMNDIYQLQKAQNGGDVDDDDDDNPFVGSDVDLGNVEDKLRKRLKATDEARKSGMLASYFE